MNPFTDRDKEIMLEALSEARKAFESDDYPVGAVIVIDDKIVGKMSNSNRTGNSWMNHAEFQLLLSKADLIKKKKSEGSKIELFSTLEPCIMCLGTSVMNRVDRIVFACPDKHGGATNIDPRLIKEYYTNRWPKIESGLLEKESRELIIKFIKTQKSEFWKRMLKYFEDTL